LVFGVIVIPVILYLILLIPGAAPPVQPAGKRDPFAWNRDEYWSHLEMRFKEARSVGCTGLTARINDGFDEMERLLAPLDTGAMLPETPLLVDLENNLFELAMHLAACPERLEDYIELFGRLRFLVKKQSAHWNLNSRSGRDCIYRLLYGGRTAIEEIMIQWPEPTVPAVSRGTDEASVTPFANILGVKIHSGDVLVSRGGAPTSALIARGNDYPGNFSHVALVHVDEETGIVSIIESHIECGVTVSRIEDYLRDTKLRVMVLRLRADLPLMRADPMLPHRAAKHALHRAMTEHIPYDFEMDFSDGQKMFCSEVASGAYRQVGVNLWMGLSYISSAGVKSWLAAFGVKNFITQEPSDLEYDPQLRVVAEWRDYETLYKDRLDNAVVDVMLEAANKGARLDYDLYLLPVARVLKAYSVVLNRCGGVGPIPKGMSATAALRNQWFSNRHRKVKEQLELLTRRFEETNGHMPPYWELIKLARQAYDMAGD